VISVNPTMRILVAVEPADFRQGIDGIAALCRQRLAQDPLSGSVFVFRNRRGTAIKLLFYDGQGFWLCQKRLSRGRFSSWPSGDAGSRALEAHQLQVLLAGGDADAARGAPVWRPVTAPVERQ
jgi:transposase